MPFTDAQLVLLSAASQHPDGLLPRPDKLVGATLARMEAALLRSGAVEPVPVRADQPRWRLDEAESPIGLRITTAGLAGIGVEPSPVPDETPSPDPRQESNAQPSPSPVGAPMRPGTKLAQLVALLSGPDGCSIDALVRALGWQAHTVRAALTRLRQSGFAIARASERGRSTYRITPEAERSDDVAVTTDRPDATGAAEEVA